MCADHLTRHQIAMHSSSSYVALTSAAVTLASSTMTTVTMAPTTTVMSSNDTTTTATAKTSTITPITSISVTPIVTTTLTDPLDVATSSVSTTCTFAHSNSATFPPALHDNHNNLISSSQHLSSQATTTLMNSSDSYSITSVHGSHLSTSDTGLKQNSICFKCTDPYEASAAKPSREKTVSREYPREKNDDTNQFGSDHGRVSPCQARWQKSYNFGVLHHPEVQLSQIFYDTCRPSVVS